MRDTLQALWAARSGGQVAWTLWRHGLCEGCTLGHGGPHLCLPGLHALRQVSAPDLVPADLLDIQRLRRLGGSRGRLAHPYRYRAGARGFRRIAWKEALDELGGDCLIVGTPHSEETRAAITGLAAVTPVRAARSVLQETLGCEGGTAALEDLQGADLILLWRAHTALNPLLLGHLRAARRRGARLIVVDEEGDAATLYDDWLRISPQGDQALSDAVLALLRPSGGHLSRFTTGLDALSSRRKATREGALAAGVPTGSVEWVVRCLQQADRCLTVVSDRAPAEALRAIVNLHLATDQVSGPGRGVLLLSTPSQGGLVLQRPGLRAHLHHSLEEDMLDDEESVLLLPTTALHERVGGALVSQSGLGTKLYPQLLHPPAQARDPWAVLDELRGGDAADVASLRARHGLFEGQRPRPCRDHDYPGLPDGLARFS